eukprot:g12242.t1
MRTAFVSVILLVTGVIMAPVHATRGGGQTGAQSLEAAAHGNTIREDGFSDAADEGDSDASPPEVEASNSVTGKGQTDVQSLGVDRSGSGVLDKDDAGAANADDAEAGAHSLVEVVANDDGIQIGEKPLPVNAIVIVHAAVFKSNGDSALNTQGNEQVEALSSEQHILHKKDILAFLPDDGLPHCQAWRGSNNVCNSGDRDNLTR